LKGDAEGLVSRYENEICMRIRQRRVAVILEFAKQAHEERVLYFKEADAK